MIYKQDACFLDQLIHLYPILIHGVNKYASLSYLIKYSAEVQAAQLIISYYVK